MPLYLTFVFHNETVQFSDKAELEAAQSYLEQAAQNNLVSK